MSDPVQVRNKLDQYSDELDKMSKDLAEIERRLEPVQAEYEEYIETHAVGLWEKAEEGAIKKLPSVELRLQLARHEMPPELLGRYTALLMKRDRMMKRIGTLKTLVDAQRSILSALKAEMDATR